MLSKMAAQFFSQSSLMSLPIVALFIFAGVFLAVTVRAVRGDKSRFDKLARLPLEGER